MRAVDILELFQLADELFPLFVNELNELEILEYVHIIKEIFDNILIYLFVLVIHFNQQQSYGHLHLNLLLLLIDLLFLAHQQIVADHYRFLDIVDDDELDVEP